MPLFGSQTCFIRRIAVVVTFIDYMLEMQSVYTEHIVDFARRYAV